MAGVSLFAGAASGDQWKSDVDGNWTDGTKWLSGAYPNSNTALADFSNVDISADRTVLLAGGSILVRDMAFGDAGGTPFNWFLGGATDSLKMEHAYGTGTPPYTSPTIAVTNGVATINAAIVGPTAGAIQVAKLGPGMLVLNNSANNISTLEVLEGTVSVSSIAKFGSSGGSPVLYTLKLGSDTGAWGVPNPGQAGTLRYTGAAQEYLGSESFGASVTVGSNPNGGGIFDVSNPAGTLIVNGAISGGLSSPAITSQVAVTKKGAGTLVLDGSNTYNGNVRIEQGTVRIYSAGALGGNSNSVVLDGGTFDFAQRPGTTDTIYWSPPDNQGIIVGPAGGTFNIGLGFVYLWETPGVAQLSGTGDLRKTGPGVLDIDGDFRSSYTGNLIIDQGVVTCDRGNSLNNNPVTINAGGELSLWSPYDPAGLQVIDNKIILNGGNFGSISFDGTFTGPIDITAASTLKPASFAPETGVNWTDGLEHSTYVTGVVTDNGNTVTISGSAGNAAGRAAGVILTNPGNVLTGQWVVVNGGVLHAAPGAINLATNVTLNTSGVGADDIGPMVGLRADADAAFAGAPSVSGSGNFGIYVASLEGGSDVTLGIGALSLGNRMFTVRGTNQGYTLAPTSVSLTGPTTFNVLGANLLLDTFADNSNPITIKGDAAGSVAIVGGTLGSPKDISSLSLASGNLRVPAGSVLRPGNLSFSGGSIVIGSAPSGQEPGRLLIGSDLYVDDGSIQSAGFGLNPGTLDLGGVTRTVNVNAGKQFEIGARIANGTIASGGSGWLLLSGKNAQAATNVGNGSRIVITDPAGGISDALGGAPVNLNGGTLSFGVKAIYSIDTPGLKEGYVSGAANGNDYPFSTQIVMGTGRMDIETWDSWANYAEVGWANNRTYVYTGWMNIPEGKVAFGENFDDWVQVKVDGNVVLENGDWSVPTASGVVEVTPGWHQVEFRFGQGGGGVGPVNNDRGWYTQGFGVDLTDPIATATVAPIEANYVTPTDSGFGNLFAQSVTVVREGVAAPGGILRPSNVNVNQSSTIEMDALPAGTILSMATLKQAPGTTLTIEGGQALMTFSNTDLTVSGNRTIAGSGNLSFGRAVDGSATGTLTKQGTGTLTLDNTSTVAPNDLSGTTIDLRAGRLLVVGAAGGSDPLAGANFQFNGGTLGLASSGGNVTFDLAIAANASGAIQHIGITDDTLGSATKGISVGGGYTLNLAVDGGSLTVPGAVTGGGAVVKSGGGTLKLTGATAFNPGSFTVNGGVTQLDRTPANAFGPMSIVAGSVQPQTDEQIKDGANVAISGTGRLNLNGHVETIGGLNFGAGAGSVIGAGVLNVGAVNKTGGNVSTVAAKVNVTGPVSISQGALAFTNASADANAIAGPINVSSDGQLVVTPSGASNPLGAAAVSVDSASIVFGTQQTRRGMAEKFYDRGWIIPWRLNGEVKTYDAGGIEDWRLNDLATFNSFTNSQVPTISRQLTAGINWNTTDVDTFISEGFGDRDDMWGRWDGKLYVPAAGEYIFRTNSDDGSKIWIDGAQVVDNFGWHGMQTREGRITLQPGLHSVVVGFYEGGGGAGMIADYTPPGGALTILGSQDMVHGPLTSMDGDTVLANAVTFTGDSNVAVNNVRSGRITNATLGGALNTYGGPLTVDNLALSADGTVYNRSSSPVSVNNISGNFALGLSGRGTTNLGGSSARTAANTIAGGGTVNLNSATALGTGPVTVNAGTLNVAEAAAGFSVGNVTVNDGGVLVLTNQGTDVGENGLTLNSGGTLRLQTGGWRDFNGNVNLGGTGTARIGFTGDVVQWNGALSGTGGITWTQGTAWVHGANTFTGPLNVEGGSFQIRANGTVQTKNINVYGGWLNAADDGGRTEAVVNHVPDDAVLTFYGGGLNRWTNVAYSETLGTVNVVGTLRAESYLGADVVGQYVINNLVTGPAGRVSFSGGENLGNGAVARHVEFLINNINGVPTANDAKGILGPQFSVDNELATYGPNGVTAYTGYVTDPDNMALWPNSNLKVDVDVDFQLPSSIPGGLPLHSLTVRSVGGARTIDLNYNDATLNTGYLRLWGDESLTIGNGNIKVGPSNTLYLINNTSGDTLNIQATISESYPAKVNVVVEANGGTVRLSNSSSAFTGGLFLNNGALLARSSDDMGSTLGSAPLTLNGGIVYIRNNGDGSNQTLGYSNDVTVANNAEINVDRASGSNYENTVQFQKLTVNDGRTIRLTGWNGYRIAFTDASFPGAAATLYNNTAVTIGGSVTGTARITKEGPGWLNFSGYESFGNPFGGKLVINQGSVQLSTNVLGAQPQITVNPMGTLMVNYDNMDMSQVMFSHGSLRLYRNAMNKPAGTLGGLILDWDYADNTADPILWSDNYDGLRMADGAMLTTARGNAMTWASDLSLLGYLEINTPNLPDKPLTISGLIGGELGSINKTGSGKLVLSAPNTFGAGATVSAGELVVGNTSALGTGPVAVEAGAILNITAPNVPLAGARILGTLRLGAAMSTLEGASVPATPVSTLEIATMAVGDDFDGLRIAAGGTLSNLVDGATYGSDLVLEGGTTLAGQPVSLGGSISGAGGMSVTGIVSLSGTNSFAGGVQVRRGGIVSSNAGYALGTGLTTVEFGGMLNLNAQNSGDSIQAPGGAININYDGAIIPGSTVDVRDGGYVNVAKRQTVPPMLTIGTGGALLGDTTNFLYTGAGKNVTFEPDATLANDLGTPEPARADIGGAILYRGIIDAAGTYTFGDDGTNIYKGGSFGAWTNSPVFTGSISEAAGNLAPVKGLDLLMARDLFLTEYAAFNVDNAANSVFFKGSGKLTFNAPVGGNALHFVREGRLDARGNTTNDAIVDLNAAGAIKADQTLTVRKGVLDMSGGPWNAVAGKVIIGENAALRFDGAPTTGAFEIEPTGLVRLDAENRLTSGASWTFQDKSMVLLVNNMNTTTANLPGNVDIILHGGQNRFAGKGIVLGQNAALLTSQNDTPELRPASGDMANDSILTAAPGATSVRLGAAPGRALWILEGINMPDTDVYVGSTQNYYLPESTNSMKRQLGGTPLNGTVLLLGTWVDNPGANKVVSPVTIKKFIQESGSSEFGSGWNDQNDDDPYFSREGFLVKGGTMRLNGQLNTFGAALRAGNAGDPGAKITMWKGTTLDYRIAGSWSDYDYKQPIVFSNEGPANAITTFIMDSDRNDWQRVVFSDVTFQDGVRMQGRHYETGPEWTWIDGKFEGYAELFGTEGGWWGEYTLHNATATGPTGKAHVTLGPLHKDDWNWYRINGAIGDGVTLEILRGDAVLEPGIQLAPTAVIQNMGRSRTLPLPVGGSEARMDSWIQINAGAANQAERLTQGTIELGGGERMYGKAIDVDAGNTPFVNRVGANVVVYPSPRTDEYGYTGEIIASRYGDDKAVSGMTLYEKVTLKQGAIAGMQSWDDTRIQLGGTDTGQGIFLAGNAEVRAADDADWRRSIGNVALDPSVTSGRLALGRGFSEWTNYRLIGSLAPGVHVAAEVVGRHYWWDGNPDANRDQAPLILLPAGSDEYRSYPGFQLNGGTLETRIPYIVNPDDGRNVMYNQAVKINFNVGNGTLLSGGLMDLRYGANGTDVLPSTLAVGDGMIGFGKFLVRVGSGVTRTLPQMNVEAGEAGVVQSIKSAPADAAGALVINTVNVAAGGNLSLTPSQGVPVRVQTANIAQNGGLFYDYDTYRNTTWAPNPDTSALEASVNTIAGGANKINLGGTNMLKVTGNVTAGSVVIRSANGHTTGGVLFDPGTGNTSMVSGDVQVAPSSTLSVASGTVNLGSKTISSAAQEEIAGLREQYIWGRLEWDNWERGRMTDSDRGPASEWAVISRTIKPGTDAAQITDRFGDDFTLAYSGQIYIPDNGTAGDGYGSVRFLKQYDDDIQLYIPDWSPTPFRNNEWWRGVPIPDGGNPITLPVGWHNIDVRFGEGGGGSGPNNGWSMGFGFDFSDPIIGNVTGTGDQSQFAYARNTATTQYFRVLLPGGGGNVNVANGAVLKAASAVGLKEVKVDGTLETQSIVAESLLIGGTVKASQVQVNGLNIAGWTGAYTGLLDLGSDGELMIGNADAFVLDTITAYVEAAYNGGMWNGAGGITADEPKANDLMNLGLVLNGGVVYVMPALTGDLDLNGIQDADDYYAADNGLLAGLRGWQNGDVTHDGLVDGRDLFEMDRVYLKTGGISPLGAGGVNAVPEPGTLALLAIGAMGLLARRRRN